MGGYVSFSGSTGIDHSANAPAVPIGGYTLLQTIAANARRNYIEVQNQSTGYLQIVRDDGAGNNQTTLMIAPASQTPGQGGGWNSNTFKGRVRIYGATSATQIIAAFED